MKKRILSFDCATKTFAFCLIEIDLDNVLSMELTIPSIQKCISKFECDVINFFPDKQDKDITILERIKAVRTFLSRFDNLPNDTHIYVEYQMGANMKANIVADVILTYFYNFIDVKLVPPTLKNKIKLCSGGGYSDFTKKYKSNYTANKHHTTFNLNWFLSAFNISVSLKSSLVNHVADAFAQVIGYAQTHT
ncbi:Uncharacterised protein [uncultured archaeon]|nr:Uncharacterised protein [uncultured archaeon]